jgi:hypothetical protein
MSTAKSKFALAGHYKIEHFRDGKLIGVDHCENLVVDEGLDYILGASLAGVTDISAWYLGIFESNYTPAADDTAANIAGRCVESVAYDEANRVTFNYAAVSGQALTNSANRAVFTCNAQKTMYGLFMVSLSTKQGTTGTLISVAPFDNARGVIAGDELLVTYTMSAQDV